MHNPLSYPPTGAPIRNSGPALSPPQGHSQVSYFLIDLIGSDGLRGRSEIQERTGGAISPSYLPCLRGRAQAMPRDRWRATLDSGRKLDLAKLIPHTAQAGRNRYRSRMTYGSGERGDGNSSCGSMAGVWSCPLVVGSRHSRWCPSQGIWRAAMVRGLPEKVGARPGFSTGRWEPPTLRAGRVGRRAAYASSSWTLSGGHGARRRRSRRGCSGTRTRRGGSAAKPNGMRWALTRGGRPSTMLRRRPSISTAGWLSSG
jgi:hypothetical protein